MYGAMNLARFARWVLPAAIALFVAACSGERSTAPETHSYALGERVNLGHISYQVFETQWAPMLGESGDQRVPRDRFLVLRFSATNRGATSEIVPNMSLEDEAGGSYPELKDGSKLPLWVGYLRRVGPAESLEGTVLFDVAPRHYRLRLWDEENETSALVDLPLVFEEQNKHLTPR